MAITYDSKHAICVIRKDDMNYEVRGYDLKTFEQCWSNIFEGEFLRMNIIEQNLAGEVIALAYQDDGLFKVRVIDNFGETLHEVDVSEIINTDRGSKPIEGQNEPMIVCSFIADDNLFISAYHRKERNQYSFTYSYKEEKALSEVSVSNIELSSVRNFPVKSFYSLVSKNCHTFYRQGHGVTNVAEDPTKTWTEKITDQDMGSMFLLFDEALITRSSSSILFFKLKQLDKDDPHKAWTLYHTIEDMRGDIFFIRGNIRI